MNCFKIVFVFIMALQNVILLSVLLLFTNFSKFVFALENENACCKVGQVQGASAGHCLTLNVTSAVPKVTTGDTTGTQQQHSSDHFSCQLTAKMCCLQGQQAKLCKRVAREMMAQEPVDSLLGTALLQNRNRVRIDANASHLSELLTSVYSCDLKRNSDALCCLGCNLGLLWAVSRLAKLNGELPIQTLVSSLETVAAGNGTDNGTDWCTPSGTAHAVGQTVSESLGFRECCRQSLLAIHRNIRWCELKPAPCAHRCHEAVSEDGRSRVQCSCYEGYRLAEDGRSCVDADECAQLTHNCDPNYEVCHNTDGGFQCVARKTPLASELFPTSGDSGQKCSPGYYFNATEGRCKDIDECRHSLHECNLSRQVCRNLLGAYVCLDIGRGGQQQGCPSGFRPTSSSAGSPLNCTDVDECAEGTYDCDRREQCENFIGSYTCEEKVMLRTDSGSSSTTRSSIVETENSSNSNLTNCAKGYHFVRFSYTCEDTNECRIGQHDCDLSRERCINFPGTYRCVPLVLGEGKGSGGGDSGDAGTGAEEKDKQSSARLSSLRFTQKLCPSGYERNEELNICEDSDECDGGLLPPCSENAYCQNTIGSYVCHCKTGFIKPANDSHFCEDVNECTGGLHNCFGTLKCVNTVGSFECLPRQPDFVSSSSTLNERSQIGLYSEEKCDRGQIYDSTKKTCVGKSGGGEFELGGDQTGKSRQVRCESGERIIDGECRTVSCSTGFFYNSTERRCQDLNECLQYSPCSSAEKCTNTIGSYRCSIRCTAGYQKVNFGQSCEDVDECALGTYRCPAGQVCKNRPGGYTCQCPPGYLGSADQGGSGQCEDVDECISSDGQEVSVCGEHQLCINTPGSFRCQCKAGFREERAHFGSGPGTGALRCVDQDECDSSSSSSSSSSGGYHHRCEHLCLNYAGSYKCACKSGFQLAADGFTCVDINECETLGKPKSSDSKESNNRTSSSGDQVCYHKCINQPGSFQCTCPPGYESLSEGRICKDIDECESGELCRGQNEYCLNVHGSYRCNVINCPDDYYLDARSKKCIRHAPKNPSENYDINLPLSYSYNYLGIVSNVRIPSSGHLDLLAMSGPVFSITAIKFELNVTSAKPHRYGVPPATREHFLLRRPSYDQIIVSLTKPIEGPQDIELVLTVSLYNEALFAGSTKAFINVVVSEYEF